jgi:hypothetical protein
MKILKEDENNNPLYDFTGLNEDEFISRLDGTVQKRNGRKSINEDPSETNPNWDAFSLAGKAYAMNNGILDNTSLKYLYMEWNFPKETIDMIYYYFGNSFDETNTFLNILDGSESLENAWGRYTDDNDIAHELFPF